MPTSFLTHTCFNVVSLPPSLPISNCSVISIHPSLNFCLASTVPTERHVLQLKPHGYCVLDRGRRSHSDVRTEAWQNTNHGHGECAFSFVGFFFSFLSFSFLCMFKHLLYIKHRLLPPCLSRPTHFPHPRILAAFDSLAIFLSFYPLFISCLHF